MRIFLETSALAKRYVEEVGSAQVRALHGSPQPKHPLLI